MENIHSYLVMTILLFCPLYIAQKATINPDSEVLRNLLQNETFAYGVKDVLSYNPHNGREYTLKNNTRTQKSLPHLKKVKNFYLWTKEFRRGKMFEKLIPSNITNIKSSHFKTRKTFIIIHGFLGDGLEQWIINLRDKLFEKNDCNVISVEWPAGNSWVVVSYITSVRNVPSVGSDVSELLKSLIKYKGALLEDVHFIGHSLGAHAAGYASKVFKGRVGRITGLDPAGPEYHKEPPSERLDKTDASYVDVIHTNACERWFYMTDCFGLDENIGHSDFWPNGGKHQPSCTSKTALRGDIGCDHMASHDYYIESLDYSPTSTMFLARPCSSWALYLSGNCSCGSIPQHMGFNVNTMASGVFYLLTDSEPPYALPDWGCPGGPAIPPNLILFIACGFLIILLMAGWFLFSSCIISAIKSCLNRAKTNSEHRETLIPEGETE